MIEVKCEIGNSLWCQVMGLYETLNIITYNSRDVIIWHNPYNVYVILSGSV
jgi:hypothetical protein